MATLLSVLLAGSALVGAQDFSGGDRSEEAFQYVQPLDTVILDEYGSSPAVYPSRKLSVVLEYCKFELMKYSQCNRSRWLGRCPAEGKGLRSSAHH